MKLLNPEALVAKFRKKIVGDPRSLVPSNCPNPRLIELRTVDVSLSNPIFIAVCPGVRKLPPTIEGRVYDQPPICRRQCIFHGNEYYPQSFTGQSNGSLTHNNL